MDKTMDAIFWQFSISNKVSWDPVPPWRDKIGGNSYEGGAVMACYFCYAERRKWQATWPDFSGADGAKRNTLQQWVMGGETLVRP